MIIASHFISSRQLQEKEDINLAHLRSRCRLKYRKVCGGTICNKDVQVMLAPLTFDQSQQPAAKRDANRVIVQVV